jgi:hypothetical protein
VGVLESWLAVAFAWPVPAAADEALCRAEWTAGALEALVTAPWLAVLMPALALAVCTAARLLHAPSSVQSAAGPPEKNTRIMRTVEHNDAKNDEGGGQAFGLLTWRVCLAPPFGGPQVSVCGGEGHVRSLMRWR